MIALIPCPAAASIWAAADGAGRACTRSVPCALSTAQAAARQAVQHATGDIVVELTAGTYRLAAPWTFSPADSGTPGHRIVYQAAGYGGPSPAKVVVSGGLAVTGPWTRVATLAGGLAVYRAAVPAALETRQLYVNGRRVERPTSIVIPADLARTADGYVTRDPGFARWRNPRSIEFRFTAGDYGTFDPAAPQPFTEALCGVDRIERIAAQTRITLNPLCNGIAAHWGGSRWYADGAYRDFGRPSRIENAYELLALPGQWYLDRTGAVAGNGVRAVYYVPRAGEDMGRAEVIAPVLATLVEGRGTANLTFRGLTFAYATWNEPSLRGMVVEQANLIVLAHEGVGQPTRTGYIHGNIHFAGARALVFERDRFEHLGGDALVLDGGAQDNRVQGSSFADVSGAGIRIGDYANPQAPPPLRETDNVIADNVLHDLPREYRSGNAIFTGYTQRTKIEHNLVFDTPYTAVSGGYGFGMPNYQSGFRFTGNHLYNFGQVLIDGGGVYTNSRQGTSFADGAVIEGNWIHNQGNPYNAIYNDESAEFVTVRHNVLYNNFHDWGSCRPLGNLVFTDNFWQTGRPHLGCRPFIPEPVTIARNTLLDRGRVNCARLAACAAIMASAGIRAQWAAAAGRGCAGRAVSGDDPAWRRAGPDRMLAVEGTRVLLYGRGAGTIELCAADGGCEPLAAIDSGRDAGGTGLLWTSGPRTLGRYTLRVHAGAALTIDRAETFTEPLSIDDAADGDGIDRFAFRGAWIRRADDTGDNPTDSTYDASVSVADTPGATVTLRFFGTGARLYGLQHPMHGIGTLAIDGGTPADIDFFGYERLGDQALWESPELPRGLHTLTLAWTGRRNALATGTRIALDRVEVFP